MIVFSSLVCIFFGLSFLCAAESSPEMIIAGDSVPIFVLSPIVVCDRSTNQACAKVLEFVWVQSFLGNRGELYDSQPPLKFNSIFRVVNVTIPSNIYYLMGGIMLFLVHLDGKKAPSK